MLAGKPVPLHMADGRDHKLHHKHKRRRQFRQSEDGVTSRPVRRANFLTACCRGELIGGSRRSERRRKNGKRKQFFGKTRFSNWKLCLIKLVKGCARWRSSVPAGSSRSFFQIIGLMCKSARRHLRRSLKPFISSVKYAFGPADSAA